MKTTDPADAIVVSEAAASDRASWDRFVDSHESATIYHRWQWQDVIRDCFGKPAHYLKAERDGNISGVIPLIRLKSVLFGDFLVSMPYLSYGGVVANDEHSRDALLDASARLSRELGVRHAELRHTQDLVSWPKRTDKVGMHLQLCGDSEARWKLLGSKRRAQIKRPKREGVETTIGSAELIDDFYSVLSRKYRDLGTPVYPVRWFRTIAERFPDSAKVFVVRLHGRPVAASLVVADKDRLEVPYAASLRDVDRFGVNMYLYWCMVEYAENNGFQIFDFGRSTVDSGTFRFKKQWGAEVVPLYWHYWLRDGGNVPVLNTSNPKYELLINTWRKLPVWVTRLVGPRIVRNLP